MSVAEALYLWDRQEFYSQATINDVFRILFDAGVPV